MGVHSDMMADVSAGWGAAVGGAAAGVAAAAVMPRVGIWSCPLGAGCNAVTAAGCFHTHTSTTQRTSSLGQAQWGHNYDVVLPELLAAGVRVMICEHARRGGRGAEPGACWHVEVGKATTSRHCMSRQVLGYRWQATGPPSFLRRCGRPGFHLQPRRQQAVGGRPALARQQALGVGGGGDVDGGRRGGAPGVAPGECGLASSVLPAGRGERSWRVQLRAGQQLQQDKLASLMWRPPARLRSIVPDGLLQAGTVTAVDGLSFVKVFQAGHMVSCCPAGDATDGCVPAGHCWQYVCGCRLASSCLLPQLTTQRSDMTAMYGCLPAHATPFTRLPCQSPPATQVPMDQAKNGLDMITRFTRGEPLATSGPAAASSRHVRRPPTEQSGAKLLPGAMWQLRRAMPDRQTSLTAAEAEE